MDSQSELDIRLRYSRKNALIVNMAGHLRSEVERKKTETVREQ